MLYLPCRQHIFELISKYVLLDQVLSSTTVGPNIPLSDRFKKMWNTFELGFFNFGTTDTIVQKHISKKKADEISNYCLEILETNICRDDYKELLELCVMFLGHSLPNGNKFRKPEASHHARWMSKAIYVLKIFIRPVFSFK